MPATVVQYSLVSGEISPRLLMRGDVEAYPNAARLVENFFIDYRGGAVSRPGLELVGVAPGPFRNVPIQLAFIKEGGVVLEVSDRRFRFIQNGAYVTEPPKTVTAVSGSRVTIPSHGYAVDDWLLVDSTQARVRAVIDADNIELEDVLGTPWTPAAGATVGRIYELQTPYTADDIWSLNFTVLEDEVVITTSTHPPRRLRFTSINNWTLEDIVFSSAALSTVSGLTATASNSGSSYYLYSVAAVLRGGVETASCKPVVVQSAQMSTTAGASITVRWDPVPDAEYYIVYRSREFTGAEPSLGEDLGYCGKVFGTEFIDQNTVPDFKKNPVIPYDPFAGGAIKHIGVTSGGSGYLPTSTITVSGGSGTGFSGYPILVENPGSTSTTPDYRVSGVKILNRGRNYSEPITVSVTDGSGAAFRVEVSSLTGNWPRCAARFQQRLVFAGTDNAPSTIFGSRPGHYYDFSYSIPAVDDDSYEHIIDTTGVQYIQHLLPTNSGLMVFTDGGVYTVQGDATGRAVTPLRVQVSPQMSLGAAAVPPIVIDNDILFVQSKGSAVRALRYNPVSASYSAEDLTILANHLLEEHSITDWTYAPDPFRHVLAVREDGQLLCLTYVPGQKVFAWSRFTTSGEFKTIAAVKEGGEDRVYAGVRRKINGRWLWFQEVFSRRTWHAPMDSFAVDCGLRRTGTRQSSFLVVQEDGTITASVQLSAGDLIVADGARIEVLGQTSGKVLVRPLGGWPIETSEWTLFRGRVSEVGGLEHLEGMEVAVIADGYVHTPKVVSGGKIKLDVPAWEVAVGLPFTCRLQTLPVDVLQPAVQSKRRRHWKVAVMVQASRGLYVGSSFDDLLEVKEVDLVRIGVAQPLFTGFRKVHVSGRWRDDASVCIEVRDPLPATVLGLAIQLTFGDDDVK